MDNNRSVKEFDILGYKVKLKSNEEGSFSNPEEIVEYVRERANELLNKMPHLDKGEAALLVALSLAAEKLELQGEFRENIDRFHSLAGDALQFIEEVSPTTN